MVLNGEITFAAIDFETANEKMDSACAVSVVLFNKKGELGVKTKLIRPPYKNFRYSRIHGITYDDVKYAQQFPEVWSDLSKMIKEASLLCAHNARFDQTVLKECCKRYGIPCPQKEFICTLKIAREHFKIKPARLDNVCKRLNIPLIHHDPESDAKACASIVIKAIKRGYPFCYQLELFE
ncbi:MAG: exonuclease domain-containing protein [Verrucomicrobiia bacterium]